MTDTAAGIGRGTANAGRASGKIILLGEHAVVYDAAAIAVGIRHGATATASRSADPVSSLRVVVDTGSGTYPPQEARAGGTDDLDRAWSALLDQLPSLPSGAIAAEATTTLAPGGGLGCSAALAVAIARAVVRLGAGEPTEDDVALAARAWEEIFHGNPSGIDTAAAMHGGCLVYTRAAGAKPLRLPVDLWLCVGTTGKSSSTRVMVEGVARRRERDRRSFDATLGGIRTLVDNAKLAIEAGDTAALGKLMDLNQMLLAGWMLSIEEIETMCRIARARGALGAKLTGAGGGGSVIALLPDETVGEAVLEAWRTDGFDGFLTCVEAGG